MTVTFPNNITVVWDEVTEINQNGIITLYEVQYTPSDNFGAPIISLTLNVSSPMQTLDILGLQAYVNYSISVRAYTSAGPGPYSNPQVALTDQDGE